MLEAAITSLATGDPAAVSGNRIARDIGATWGVIKYQFGDIDGLWAAVLRHTADKRGDLPAVFAAEGALPERVAALVRGMAAGLRRPESLAIETLRAALPREHAELEREFPRTAAVLASWKPHWDTACARAFADLDLDPVKMRRVAALLPAALRGITSERTLGTYGNLDDALEGLIGAITAYLEPDTRSASGRDPVGPVGVGDRLVTGACEDGPVRVYRDEAVVVRQHKLGEADRIVTLLTRRHGLVRAVAKGVRRTKSRFGARLEPFSYIDVQLHPGRTLDTVTQVHTLEAFAADIIDDYGRYTTACAVLETAERLAGEERAPAPKLHALTASALRAIAAKQRPHELILDAYLLRAMRFSGWAPAL